MFLHYALSSYAPTCALLDLACSSSLSHDCDAALRGGTRVRLPRVLAADGGAQCIRERGSAPKGGRHSTIFVDPQ